MAVLLQIFAGDLEIDLADMFMKLVGDDFVLRDREKKQEVKEDAQHQESNQGQLVSPGFVTYEKEECGSSRL